MKKLLVLVLSIMLVAGAFTAVYASDGGMDSVRSAVSDSKIVIGGDARVRGTCRINYDLDDDADDDSCKWDQRVRLKITAQITGGVEVRVRLTAGNGDWNGGMNTGSTVVTDYAYIVVPVGTVTIEAGRQPFSWGNKFLVWDARVDRLEIVAGLDTATVGVFADKLVESYGPEGILDNDVNDYGVYAVYNANDVEAGVVVVFRKNDVMDDSDGIYGSLYANVDVSGVSVSAEVAARGDDAFYLNADEDTQYGGFVSASMAMDALTVGALGAFTLNGYVADTHFTPSLFIGTDQPSAMLDFGDMGDTLLGAVFAGYQATPELNVSAVLAYVSWEGYPDSDTIDASAFEVDANLTYNLAKNTTYSAGIGYLSPDDLSSADDAAITVVNAIKVYFD